MVLPESGPTPTLKPKFFSRSISALKPACAWASVVNMPRNAEPMPAERSAASAGPFGLVTSSSLVTVVISSSPSSRDRGDFVDEGTEETRHARGGEGDDEERDEDFAHALLLRQTRSVVEDDEGNGGRDDRGEPGDVLLPLHTEVVPFGLRGIGEQEGAGAGLRRVAVPGVDDPRSADHGDPGNERHDGGAELEARQPLADAGDRDQVRAQAVQSGEPAREREQERRTEHHPVEDGPGLACGQFHRSSFLTSGDAGRHLHRGRMPDARPRALVPNPTPKGPTALGLRSFS